MPLAARAVSLLGAVALSLGLLLLPAMRGREISRAGHAWLTPLLLVVCALFVHGIGYVPHRAWLARLESPPFLWPLAAWFAIVWWRVS